MNRIYRTQTKLRKIGNSHVVTVPSRTRWLWDMQDGDPVVTYQIGDVMLTLPLSYLPKWGEHPIVRQLIALQQIEAH